MVTGTGGSRVRAPIVVLFNRWVTHPIRRVSHFVTSLHSAKLVLLGYLSYILTGWILLCLPVAHAADYVPALDNLFSSTSAVSTTGLTTLSVADRYSLFGQIVILLLIQLGGIGYMTIGSFIVLSRGGKLPEIRHRVGGAVYALPESFRVDKFIMSVIRFTIAIELAGAVALYFLFRQAHLPDAAWSAVFHSISAFCTAGFSLYNDSFVSHATNFWINLVIAALSYLGAIGFIVCVDVWRVLRRKVDRITMTSRIILWATAWLTVGGTVLLFLTEPSIAGLPADDRLLAAFFQCMTAMTTVGFNSIDTAALSKASVLLVIVLMVIGASPSGTGGGIKSTSVSAMLGVMMSSLRGETEVRFAGRPIPLYRVFLATASIGFYIVTLIAGAYTLDLVESAPFEQCFFESASALGTVGLSMGITAGLSNLGKIIIVLLMFAGRVGPLTLAVAVFYQPRNHPAVQDADLAI